MNDIRLGRLGDLDLMARPSAVVGSLLLWAALAVAGILLLALPPALATALALGALVLHWVSEVVHQLGHAWAARRTGYPMIGVRFWAVLGTSLYPHDEPRLPGNIHIQRAFGGPFVSLLLTILAAATTLALRPVGGGAWLLAIFLYLDNLLVFTLGAVLPLRFTDGGVIMYWMNRR